MGYQPPQVTADQVVQVLQELFPLQLQVAVQQVQIQLMTEEIARSSEDTEDS